MQKVLLVILDGFGYNPGANGNAIENANPEFYNSLVKNYPFTTIDACGEQVGLPNGQMGNSEVGHMNIGSGRVVYQDITKIDLAIRDKSFFDNEVLVGLVNYAKSNKKPLHLIGLISDGGVHSSLEHLFALLELAKKNELTEVYIHCLTDGRDTSPTSGVEFIRQLHEKTLSLGVGKIASISGRYYGMDRDKRWDRVEKFYRVMIHGEGNSDDNPVSAMENSYKNDKTDEFVLPTVILEEGKPIAKISEGDAVFSFNFRSDRVREISEAINDENFNEFPTEKLNLHYATMTQYRSDFGFPIAFPPVSLKNILGGIIAERGMNQLRIAETEKYAHVTFFFNGGREEPFKNEDRILVPSPKVATYDLQPEMSAPEVTEKLLEAIESEKHDLIVLNYANPDMVGHTGFLDAATKAIQTVDNCLSQIIPAFLAKGGAVLLSADHGNSDEMITENGDPMTAHSLNKVPFILIDENRKASKLRADGKLSDIAPTILDLMEIPQPEEMTGKSMILG
ncbi:MAG: 2,3-bisphosphoglycerate-independent phosphoglycerate mutase [Calditrichaeota bacterium]|nr:MAG: 2,3-bisphosphoglycerate-independent phosphoglycerate mutase [Calditrichota bacterium]